MSRPRRLIVALTGASGARYGVRLLELLGAAGVERHVVASPSAGLTLKAETGLSPKDLHGLAEAVHAHANIGACIASGSYRIDGMIIAPCSMNTMSTIAGGVSSDLISRAADVMLKERRPLVLMVRETPLHAGHLDRMASLARLGATIFPPVPAFYQGPRTIEDLVDQSCMRALDQLGVEIDVVARWGEPGGVAAFGDPRPKDAAVSS